MRYVIVIFLLLGGFLLSQAGPKVKLVNNGETFELENGAEVKLLGIDAPELYEPGGDIAKEMLEKFVLGKEVKLEKNKTDQDDYKRLLRYVYVGDLFVNAEMIRRGFAEVRFFPPDTLHEKEFETFQESASLTKKGLWAFNAFQTVIELEKGEPIILESNKQKIESTVAIKAKAAEKPKGDVISWEDADKYYGQVKTVEGKIVTTYNSGKACFLYFHQDYRNHFSAVISTSDFHKFPSRPEDYYLVKKVRVTGLITQNKGKPEIVLKSSSQIEIVE